MPWFAIIGVALAVAGAAAQTYGQLHSASAQSKAVKMQQGEANVQATRERYNQIRESQMARANIVQTGTNQGAGMSSSVVSGSAGAMSQGYGNIEWINSQQAANQEIAKARQAEIQGQGYVAIGSGLKSVGSSIASAGEGGVFD